MHENVAFPRKNSNFFLGGEVLCSPHILWRGRQSLPSPTLLTPKSMPSSTHPRCFRHLDLLPLILDMPVRTNPENTHKKLKIIQKQTTYKTRQIRQLSFTHTTFQFNVCFCINMWSWFSTRQWTAKWNNGGWHHSSCWWHSVLLEPAMWQKNHIFNSVPHKQIINFPVCKLIQS